MIHLENFISIKPILPRMTESRPSRTEVAPPKTRDERDYRDLLSEANLNFFHREYGIALENYLTLREKILIESHPELPKTDGIGWLLGDAVYRVDFSRIVELSRQQVLRLDPAGPVTLPLQSKALIPPAGLKTNPAFAGFASVSLDPQLTAPSQIGVLRQQARAYVTAGQLDQAQQAYSQAKKEALDRLDVRLAAEIAAEASAMNATYSSGNARAGALKMAHDGFTEAYQLYGTIGDTDAQKVMTANLASVDHEMAGRQGRVALAPELAGTPVRLTTGGTVPLSTLLQAGGPVSGPAIAAPASIATAPGAVIAPIASPPSVATPPAVATSPGVAPSPAVAPAAPAIPSMIVPRNLPAPQTAQTYLVASQAGWATSLAVTATSTNLPAAARGIGLYTDHQAQTIALDSASYMNTLVQNVYAARKNAKTLEDIDFYPHIATNFVAYIPHLYFFVLPMSIGDTYLALGRYADALTEYRAAAAYPYLNALLEVPFVWMKIATAYLTWGKELFRQEQPAAAKAKFETIIKTDLTIPAGSELYGGLFNQMTPAVSNVVKEIQQQPHDPVNPRIAAIILDAASQLKKIASNLNFFGIGPTDYPIFRYRYLQNVANYLADNAVQAERTFIQFRQNAESQKLDRMQMQNTVELNKMAVQIEVARQREMQDELTAAIQTKNYAIHRKQHAVDTYNDWVTIGYEASRQDWYLTWASNVGNDKKITFTNALYEGQRHDFKDVDARDFIAKIAMRRDWINWEIQRRRLERQKSEADDEIAIAATREKEARDRLQTQALAVGMAQKRYEGSQEVLEYSRDRMLNEDLWFRLAAELQDLTRQYLDMAIYAAMLMERAYELEFDRALHIIRSDYGIGGVEGLLGGDYLKRDIAQFTVDYLAHASKGNPVRLPISLRNEFPAEFSKFQDQGILAFRTDLEIFDRLFPGTYRRKIKKIEVFVEGLVPEEGAAGFLINEGVSREWRVDGGTWKKYARAMPAERMVLSSYQFRRDLSVFQPSEETLGLFEDMALQGNWTLVLPRSGNNLDYAAISDIQFIVYFNSDYNDDLATYLKTYYPNTGGQTSILSARFYYPDEYFRLDVDRKVAFAVDGARFNNNYTNLKIGGFAVKVLDKRGQPLSGAPLSIRRESDHSTVSGTTDAKGTIAGDPATMAPFAAWKNASPIDTFTVSLGGGVDSTKIGDIQLVLDYGFTYRADGSLTA